MTIQSCEAYQMSDQKCCDRCGLVWDMNDPDPPECLTEWLEVPKFTRTKQQELPISQAEQDKINRRGMAKLRDVMTNE